MLSTLSRNTDATSQAEGERHPAEQQLLGRASSVTERDPAEAAWQAARSAEVTHTHPEAATGAVAVAVAVAAACAGRSRGRHITPRELLQPVVELTPAGKVRDGVVEALDLVDQPHVGLVAHRLGNGRQVSAVDTVPFTLWCVARHFDDFEAALWATASAGGDVDTTCAIVGGILASRLGVQGIPTAWYDCVEPLPGWLEPERLGTDTSRADFPHAAPIARPEPIPVPDLVWTPGQWQRVRHGILAQSMDEKWDACLEGDRLLLFRTETRCLFEVTVQPMANAWRPVSAWVESDPDRYRRGSDETESTLLEMLLNMHFGKADRPELWERFRWLRIGS